MLANGGVHSFEDAQRTLRNTGASGVMGASGLLADPAMFSESRANGHIRPHPDPAHDSAAARPDRPDRPDAGLIETNTFGRGRGRPVNLACDLLDEYLDVIETMAVPPPQPLYIRKHFRYVLRRTHAPYGDLNPRPDAIPMVWEFFVRPFMVGSVV